MELVRRQIPTAHLTIVGGGAEEKPLKALQKQLGLEDTVSFVGLRVNPYPWMKYADALLLTSRYEGLPNTALEAMALGKPVVATDCCGAFEEIIATGARMTSSPGSHSRSLLRCCRSTSPSIGVQTGRSGAECEFRRAVRPEERNGRLRGTAATGSRRARAGRTAALTQDFDTRLVA